ncbi:hypothetical protein FSP39_022793 [Pinctada imbricata]|uniref:Protein FAM177A1 n=1 Tax=Pinctada imbricata TaxID=66713 RepID=A0AA88XXU5_PINIB|nr:hypothetical protein FSP39_022793 [Pinctada imbricata]
MGEKGRGRGPERRGKVKGRGERKGGRKGEDNSDFTNIPLEGDTTQKKKKVPRKIIHCSDGILEEYSTDEEEDKPPPPPPVNPRDLTWLPWFWYYLVTMARGTLSVADTCGEKLAWFFGITSPKYQYAIDEYYRLKAEEEKEKAEETRRLEILEERKLSQVKVQTSEPDPNKDDHTNNDETTRF